MQKVDYSLQLRPAGLRSFPFVVGALIAYQSHDSMMVCASVFSILTLDTLLLGYLISQALWEARYITDTAR